MLGEPIKAGLRQSSEQLRGFRFTGYLESTKSGISFRVADYLPLAVKSHSVPRGLIGNH